MFDQIAGRYDLLNRVMSLGMDRGWRRKLVAALAVPDSGHILDVATGTADVALAIARTHRGAIVVGLDPSAAMLDVGRGKIDAAGLTDRITLVPGDAQRLPFDDDSFDGVCISFGIRNVPDRLAGLKQMTRVTRPGGKVCVLELSEPKSPLARFHVHQIVPRLGAWLSGSSEYDYLQRSIAAFPPPDEFSSLMTMAGLHSVTAAPLAMGAAHLFVGTV